jgi:ring-1,2-phenylacetyl-CoA epoxidase subunit PaaE
MNKSVALKVASVERETEDAVTIHLKQPLLRKIQYAAGQYLTLEVDADGGKGCRAYSISSTPGLDKALSITVKRVAGGQVSNRLVQQVSAGDELRTLGARGRFVFSPQTGLRRHLVLFAAGSGITPVFSILKSALHFEPASRVSLVYGNRNRESVIFRDKLERLQAMFPERLRVLHVLSRPDVPCAHSGRLTRERVSEVLAALPSWDGDRTEFYACGPGGMMEEVTAGLAACGVPDSAIHMESFSPPKPAAAAPSPVASLQSGGSKRGDPAFSDHPSNDSKRVSLDLHGEQFEFPVAPGQTLLEAALASGLQLPFSCRSGFCTACMCTRLSGEIQMREEHGLSAAEVKEGHALMCIGYPISDELRLRIE